MSWGGFCKKIVQGRSYRLAQLFTASFPTLLPTDFPLWISHLQIMVKEDQKSIYNEHATRCETSFNLQTTCNELGCVPLEWRATLFFPVRSKCISLRNKIFHHLATLLWKAGIIGFFHLIHFKRSRVMNCILHAES